MTEAETLPAQLRALIDAIDACERDAVSIVDDMSDDEVNRQVEPARSWSVAQCLDHLLVMNNFYLKGFVPIVDAAVERGGSRFNGLYSSAGARWFIRWQEPPVKRRMKAPRQVVPRSTVPKAGLADAFKASHAPYRHLVRQAAHVDVNQVKGPNPFLRFITMRTSTVLQIIPAHDRRHLWQATNVKRALRGG
jgi:DinB superfamily